MKARWFMSTREIDLCRMTQILFWCVGSLCGGLAVLLWAVNPIIVVFAVALLYFLGVFLWERIARRIIGQKLLAF